VTAVAFVAAHALLLLALAATAYVAGRLAWRLLSRAAEGKRSALARDAAAGEAEEGARSATASSLGASEATALGLVVLATLGCLLGLAGALATAPLVACVAALHLAGVAVWRERWHQLARRAAELRRPRPTRRRVGWAAAAAGVAFAPIIALALYPPTAFDETLYHLPFARAFAASGGLPFLPDLRFPVFPQLAEVLDAEMLLVGGDVATHLVSLLAVGLTGGVLAGWGREWAPTEAVSAGWLAAAAWLGNPIVVYLAGTGYVEPLLALFVTAALRAFWRWRHGGGRAWLALAAVLAAAAAGTKYLGLYFVLTLALATLAVRPLDAAASRRGARIGALAAFAAVAAVTMAPWYGRIVALTGNPVFPYLSGVFGANAWTPVRFHTLGPSSWEALDGAAAGRHLGRLLTLPWDLVARRELVGGLPPFSPLLLLGAPLLLVALCERRLRALLALAAGFVVLFPLLPPDARHLVAVLPVLCLALAVAAVVVALRSTARWRVARARAVGPLLAALLVLPGWLYAGHRLHRQGPLPTTATERDAYLRRTLPLYPAVARLANVLRPGDVVYGLFAEQMRDFVAARFLGDWYGPHRYGTIASGLDEPAALAAALDAKGVDFLLVARAAAAERSFVEPDGRAGFELLHADEHALLYALRPAAAAGAERRSAEVRSAKGGR
jgi:hypothetical protein